MNNIDKMRDCGILTESKAILLKLVESDPTNQLLCYQCGCVLSMLGCYKESIELYEKSMEHGLSGEYLEDMYFRLAYMYIIEKEFKKALIRIKDGIAIFPSNLSFKILQSIALYNLQKKQEAFKILIENLLNATSDKTIAGYRREILACLDFFGEEV